MCPAGTIVTAPPCPLCGTGLRPDASPAGLCPACLLEHALGDSLSADQHDELTDDASTIFPAGAAVGPFLILGRLGRGGMSAVYEARDVRLDRSIALKVLPQEFLHDGTFARRFAREARVVAALDHPNIVPIYASGIDDGVPWMSMPLLAGGNLGAFLESSRPAPEEAVRMLRGVADGLDYAHARGVVHRDIKPTNILLDGAGGVYIGDFGLAQMLDGDRHVTRTEAIMGTPHYIAPERALGQPADYRCDIYSLGIVAYEMLVGRLPFAADSPVAVLLKHVNEPLPAPPAGLLPRPVEEVLRRAAAKDPADRPLSARAFISSLQAALDMAPADLERLGPAIAPRHSLGGTLAKAGGAVAVFCAAIGLAWCPARNPATGVNLTASLAAEHPAAAAPSTSTDTLGPGRKDTGFPEQKPTDAPERKPSPTSVPPAGVGTPSSGEQPPPYGIEPSGTGLAPEPSEADATLALLNPPSEAPPPDPPSPPPPPDPQLAAPAVEARVADVITEPVLLEKIAPNFPPTAKALQVEGQVVLEVTVGADGTVREVEVLRSSNRVFDNFAKEALLKARYKPGERNGVPESATIEVTVSFKLD